VNSVSKQYSLARHTIGRWKDWLERSFLRHALSIKVHFPKLGLHQECSSFWIACFETMTLADAMRIVHDGEEAVP